MIDELIKSPSNSPAIGGTGSGRVPRGVGRIYFVPSIPQRRDLQGITPWRARLVKRLEEAFCEVANE